MFLDEEVRYMSMGKKILGLVSLSLLAGGGIAGGLYVANTPTNISPRAASPLVSPTQVPGLRAAFPIPSPTGALKASIAPMVTPTGVIVTEETIITAFGTFDAHLDQNGDGVVNTIDLQTFRAKKK